MYIDLDSDRHPLKTYGDLAFRVFGSWARHLINVLQSLQLFFDVALLTLASGQAIAQLAKGNVCFIVCVFIFCCAGCLLGQVRTLRTFGWLANLSIILNVLVLCIRLVLPRWARQELKGVVSQHGSRRPFSTQLCRRRCAERRAARPGGDVRRHPARHSFRVPNHRIDAGRLQLRCGDAVS